ncbi:3-keto-steroid reductase/17-beta-hydroxysteroid dehydrogenase 7-like isoform X2 [Oscarella lobularis]|uniref:3-keto-steroid reductase/17-beta-hydroxysteroid dehydrogenase 7-like isoform X2 n=1 Tax=Oscarella lobularis TaxID=121494 RepID=UPI0033139A76
MPERLAIITGANSGVGLAVARRLFEDAASEQRLDELRVCLACRSRSKAETAKKELEAEFGPDIRIDLIEMDVSRPTSVYRAVETIRSKYKYVDWLFLNAGIMPVSRVNWSAFWPPYPSHVLQALVDGGQLLECVDELTEDGLQAIFATNVFGHFLLVKGLEDFLANQGQPAHVIWTSSATALKQPFDIDDIQHVEGNDPYGSSKYAIDLLSLALNEKLNKRNIYSHVVCPGLIMTNMTLRILPGWIWYLLYPVAFLMRLINGSWTYFPYCGAEALVWLAKQAPEGLNHSAKYHSRCTPFGRSYVETTKNVLSQDIALKLYEKLNQLAGKFET